MSLIKVTDLDLAIARAWHCDNNMKCLLFNDNNIPEEKYVDLSSIPEYVGENEERESQIFYDGKLHKVTVKREYTNTSMKVVWINP